MIIPYKILCQIQEFMAKSSSQWIPSVLRENPHNIERTRLKKLLKGFEILCSVFVQISKSINHMLFSFK